MKYIREYGTTVLILLVGALLVYKLAGGGAHPLTGQAAPDFSLPRIDGETATLASHLGKDVVVLDFWASWCPPCRDGLPVLDVVAKDFKDQAVAVYAINIRESKDAVAAFAEANKLSLPILLDDTGVIADDYGVTGIPQTVIIDKSGTIRQIHVGNAMWGLHESLTDDINAALQSTSEAP